MLPSGLLTGFDFCAGAQAFLQFSNASFVTVKQSDLGPEPHLMANPDLIYESLFKARVYCH
jgi:hypothetical protein